MHTLALAVAFSVLLAAAPTTIEQEEQEFQERMRVREAELKREGQKAQGKAEAEHQQREEADALVAKTLDAAAKLASHGQYAEAARLLERFQAHNKEAIAKAQFPAEDTIQSTRERLARLARLSEGKGPKERRALLAELVAPVPTPDPLTNAFQDGRVTKAVADLRACDPAAEDLFSRKVRVTVATQGWPRGLELLLLDTTVQQLKSLGIAASATAGDDSFALDAGAIEGRQGTIDRSTTVYQAELSATARWTSKGEVVVGGMVLALDEMAFSPPTVDVKRVERLTKRVPAELLARWMAEHP